MRPQDSTRPQRGPQPRPIAERFWPKVVKGDGCWLWTAGRKEGGYGAFQVASHTSRSAHRVAWELTYGPIPRGLLVCHKCDNRLCVRPDHLFLGTIADNVRDMRQKGRQSRGEDRPNHKLTADAVRDIRQRYEARVVTMPQLAGEYGVHVQTIYLIVSHRRWKHV